MLAVILAAAALLRFYELGQDSLWIDEVSSIPFSRPGGIWESTRQRGPLDPILSYLVTGAAFHLPLPIEWAARVPMAIFGVIEVGLVYLLGRDLAERRVGLLAAGLLAVAPFAVASSQGVRYYTMFSALHLLSWWLVLRFRDAPPRWWIGYGVTVGLMLLTNPFGWPAWAAQLTVIAASFGRSRHRRSRLLPVVMSLGLTVALVASWYVYGALDWLAAGSEAGDLAINTPNQYAVPIDFALFWETAAWLFGNERLIGWLSGIIGILVLLSPFVTSGKQRFVAMAIGGYTFVFALAIAIAARMVGDYFAYRRLEFLLAPLLVAAAITLASLFQRLPPGRGPMAAAVISLTLIVGLSIEGVFDHYDTERTNLRGIAEVIEQTPADVVVAVGPFDPTWSSMIIEYLRWQGVDRSIQVVTDDVTADEFPVDALWFTGNPPTDDRFAVEPLNDRSRLQIIAGDASWRDRVIPIYAVRSTAADAEALESQRFKLSGLDWFLDPARPDDFSWKITEDEEP